jgi:hypothetical protein
MIQRAEWVNAITEGEIGTIPKARHTYPSLEDPLPRAVVHGPSVCCEQGEGGTMAVPIREPTRVGEFQKVADYKSTINISGLMVI